jgi:DNA-binding transcriptional regulator GbsR (MarR family)
MKKKSQEAVLHACDAIGEFIAYWGFKKSHGRVWTYLAASEQPVRQRELVKVLDLSRAAISLALQDLQTLGLAHPAGEERLSPWIAEIAVWPVITEILRQREGRLLDRARDALRQAVAAVEAQPAHFDVGRLRALLHMTEMMRGLLRILLGLERQTSIGGLRQVFSAQARQLLARLPLSRRAQRG